MVPKETSDSIADNTSYQISPLQYIIAGKEGLFSISEFFSTKTKFSKAPFYENMPSREAH